jgi:hypothetical protein
MNMKIVPCKLKRRCRISYHSSTDTVYFLQVVADLEDRNRQNGNTGSYLDCNADVQTSVNF